jgi:hypothetical protein
MKIRKIGHWRILSLSTATKKMIWGKLKDGAVLKTSTQNQNHWRRILLTTSKSRTTITIKGLTTMTKKTIIADIRYTSLLNNNNLKSTKDNSPKEALINALTDPCLLQAFPIKITATREGSKFQLRSTKFGDSLKMFQILMRTLPIITSLNFQRLMPTRLDFRERPI